MPAILGLIAKVWRKVSLETLEITRFYIDFDITYGLPFQLILILAGLTSWIIISSIFSFLIEKIPHIVDYKVSDFSRVML